MKLTKEKLIYIGIGVLIGIIITSGAFCLCRCRAPRMDDHRIEFREDNSRPTRDRLNNRDRYRRKAIRKSKVDNNQTIEQDENSTKK